MRTATSRKPPSAGSGGKPIPSSPDSLPDWLRVPYAGHVNYKRMERLYQDEKLQVRRRKRKKVPFGDRQPLYRPQIANEVWSMDFVFDRTAEGRALKRLKVVDDATHEAVAVEVERASLVMVWRACWIAWRCLAACRRSYAATTAGSFAARPCSNGRIVAAFSVVSSNQESQPRRATSRVSTFDCATNASMSTGSRTCCRGVP